MSAMYSVPTGGPLLAYQLAMHDSWLQFAHSCLQTSTVDHPSSTAYQTNMQRTQFAKARPLARPTTSCMQLSSYYDT